MLQRGGILGGGGGKSDQSMGGQSEGEDGSQMNVDKKTEENLRKVMLEKKKMVAEEKNKNNKVGEAAERLGEEEKSEEKVDYEPSEERDVEEIDSGGERGWDHTEYAKKLGFSTQEINEMDAILPDSEQARL